MFVEFGNLTGGGTNLMDRALEWAGGLGEWWTFLIAIAFALAVVDLGTRILTKRPAGSADGVNVIERGSSGSGAPASRPRKPS